MISKTVCLLTFLFASSLAFGQDTAVYRTKTWYHYSVWQLQQNLPPTLYYKKYYRPDGQLERCERGESYHLYPLEIHEFNELGQDTLAYELDNEGKKRALIYKKYDEKGRLKTLSFTNDGGPITQQFDYEYKGDRLWKKTESRPGAPDRTRIIEYIYGPTGHLKEEHTLDPGGNVLGVLAEYSWNPLRGTWQKKNQFEAGRVYSIYHYRDAKCTQPVEQDYFDENGKLIQQLKLTYGKQGRVKESTLDFLSTNQKLHQEMTYNSEGHLIESFADHDMAPRGQEGRSEFTLNGAGRPLEKRRFNPLGEQLATQKWEYDPRGALISQKEFAKNGDLAREITYTRDAKGRLLEEKHLGYGVDLFGQKINDLVPLKLLTYEYNETDSVIAVYSSIREPQIRQNWFIDEMPRMGYDMTVGSQGWISLSGQTTRRDTLSREKEGARMRYKIRYQIGEDDPLVFRTVWKEGYNALRIKEFDPDGRLAVDWTEPQNGYHLKTLTQYITYTHKRDTLVKNTFNYVTKSSQPEKIEYFLGNRKYREVQGHADSNGKMNYSEEFRYQYNAAGKLTHLTQHYYSQFSAHSFKEYDSQGRLISSQNFSHTGEMASQTVYTYPAPNLRVEENKTPVSRTKEEFRYEYYPR
ncbi:MAG: hypothetical protein H6581_13775 [Bacteroidia bacterium]|nr:hypothetical protein [Bacteroidia bacterium]